MSNDYKKKPKGENTDPLQSHAIAALHGKLGLALKGEADWSAVDAAMVGRLVVQATRCHMSIMFSLWNRNASLAVSIYGPGDPVRIVHDDPGEMEDAIREATEALANVTP